MTNSQNHEDESYTAAFKEGALAGLRACAVLMTFTLCVEAGVRLSDLS